MRLTRFFVKKLRRAWAVVAASAIVAAAVTTARPATGPIRMVSSTDDRVVFEIQIDDYAFQSSTFLPGTERLVILGFGTFSVVGEPLIPGRDYLVALPPQGDFSVRYTVQRSEALGVHRLEPVPFPTVIRGEDGLVSSSVDYRLDPAIYDEVRAVVGVSAQAEGRLRHQRVVPVRVLPVAYDASTGETVLATSIRVEITISRPDGSRLDDDAGRIPARETPTWERIYSRLLVNPTLGKKWRSVAVPRPRDSETLARAAQATTGPLVKLRVGESGLHRVKASSVIGKGFPAGTATTDLRIFQRWYNDVTMSEDIRNIPFKVVEDPTGVTGEFDAGDHVVFYGQRLREDTLRDDPIEKFSDDNVYWLGPSPGVPMTEKIVAAGTVSPDTATAFFPVDLYNERDLFFQEGSPPVGALNVPSKREFYYYHPSGIRSFSVPFTLGAIEPGGTFQLDARFLGYKIAGPVKVEILNSKGTIRLTDADVPARTDMLYTSAVLSSDLLVDGLNTLRIQPIGRVVLDALIDWFTIHYRSPYRARGNSLLFNTGSLTGNQNFTITGFSRTDVMLFDISDPLTPQECRLDAGHFTDLGGGQHALSFQLDLSDQRRFAVAPIDNIREITSVDIEEDEPSNLIGSAAENGVDVLVVSHRDYLDEMQRWVDYRRAQGYEVLLADVDEIMDEFNGGVSNARAVRDFVRHFFNLGGASFLVLVGDASEDNKRVHLESGPNFVPTESFAERVVDVVFNEDEVVTTDKWYVMLGKDIIYEPVSEPADFYPDLIVGRLSVGNVSELRILLDKTLKYEQPSADDFWRRRMIRIADDAWSGPSLMPLCFRSSELDFELAEENAALITENSIPGGFDIVRFYLSNRITHPSGGCTDPGIQTNKTRLVTPDLIGELSRGATIVSFQTHMNRYLITHEWLFTTSDAFGPDQHDIQNAGKPFIVFGMGCHMSDYAVHKELPRIRNFPNGDCMSEQLLFLNNKGAVAVYASTGFEYLFENRNYTGVLAEVFFTNPPTGPMIPSGRSQARWVMGELMTTAEIENLLRYPLGTGLGARGQAKRYHTLGDPMLRIDAGPPRFDVEVDGEPFESGDLLVAAGGAGDSVSVRAVITDEVAIDTLTLEIDGADATGLMTVTPLVDVGLSASRSYEVVFDHKILPKPYDVVIRAHQAVDTSGTDYHIVAEFVLSVEINVGLKINGRPVLDGDFVPAVGDYVFTLNSPVVIDPALIRVEIDGNNVSPLDISHPTPQDSTTWLIGFSSTLPVGSHKVTAFVGATGFEYNLTVGSQAGVREVIAYPNPFSDDTYFVYSNDVQISNGAIDIFTTSGKKIAHLAIPPSARAVGQNAVYWDGTGWDGTDVANGVYLFVVSIEQGGQRTTHRGKLVRTR